MTGERFWIRGRDHEPAPTGGSGFAGLAMGRVGAAALSWVWLVVAARTLPVDEFGDLALLLAIGAIVAVVADLGLPLVLMQQASEQPGSTWTAVVLTARKRLLAGLVAAGLVVVGFSLSAPRQPLLLPAIFGLSIIATTVYTSVAAGLRSVGSAHVEGANETLSRLGVLVVGGVLLARGGGLMAAVTTYALADLASGTMLWIVARRRLGHLREPVDPGRFAIRRTAPLALGGILGTLYNKVDIWLLALLAGGGRSVALYAAAYRLLDGLLLPSSALSALVVPRTATLDHEQRRLALRHLASRSALLVGPLALVLGLLGGPILRGAFGAPYGDGATVLAILMLAAPAGAAIFVLAPAAALGDRIGFLRAVVGALVLNVAANLALLPWLDAAGAAWATVVAQYVLGWALWRLIAGDLSAEEPQNPVPAVLGHA